MRNLILCFFILIQFECKESNDFKPKEIEFIDKDIWSLGNEYFQEGKYSFLDLEKMKELELRKTSEEEIYQLLEKKITIKLTYSNSPLPKIYKGKYIPIDKLILYFDAKGTETEIANGKRYETFEKLSVAFYLYKNRLQFYSIRHRDTKADILLNSSTKDVVDYEKVQFGNLWPNQFCDRSYYDYKTLNFPKEKWLYNESDCEWEKPDFENKLKADGYYERL
jgi:hypothetical protein